MIVLTIDQRGSRRGLDLIPALLAASAEYAAPLRAFERTAGDEAQAVYDDAEAALDVAIGAAVSGSWTVGMGVGSVRLPLPRETRAGAGLAFEAARLAVERAKRTAAHLGLDAPGHPVEAARLEAELALLVLTLRRRSPQQQEASRLRDGGATQAQIADALGITQQAASARLNGALYDECQALRSAIVLALQEPNLQEGVAVSG